MRLTYLILALFGAVMLSPLASAPAQAHGGHHHGHHQVQHASMRAQLPAAFDAAAHKASTVIVEVSAMQDNALPLTPGAACNGACCAVGFPCCGSAMASSLPTLMPPSLRTLALSIRAGPADPGLDPEALPKPPKFFA